MTESNFPNPEAFGDSALRIGVLMSDFASTRRISVAYSNQHEESSKDDSEGPLGFEPIFLGERRAFYAKEAEEKLKEAFSAMVEVVIDKNKLQKLGKSDLIKYSSLVNLATTYSIEELEGFEIDDLPSQLLKTAASCGVQK